jgi:hypothetical protein
MFGDGSSHPPRGLASDITLFNPPLFLPRLGKAINLSAAVEGVDERDKGLIAERDE